jgi:hypothetical protein
LALDFFKKVSQRGFVGQLVNDAVSRLNTIW